MNIQHKYFAKMIFNEVNTENVRPTNVDHWIHFSRNEKFMSKMLMGAHNSLQHTLFESFIRNSLLFLCGLCVCVFENEFMYSN